MIEGNTLSNIKKIAESIKPTKPPSAPKGDINMWTKSKEKQLSELLKEKKEYENHIKPMVDGLDEIKKLIIDQKGVIKTIDIKTITDQDILGISYFGNNLNPPIAIGKKIFIEFYYQ